MIGHQRNHQRATSSESSYQSFQLSIIWPENQRRRKKSILIGLFRSSYNSNLIALADLYIRSIRFENYQRQPMGQSNVQIKGFYCNSAGNEFELDRQ